MSKDLFFAGGGNTTKQYDIPLEKFEQSYIESATNIKELEQILKVLRSGSEGSFPHLEVLAEKRLIELDPNSRTLRKSAPVCKQQDLPSSAQEMLGSEITEFLDDISNVDRQLRKRPAAGGAASRAREEVPVRGVGVKIDKENVKSNKTPMPRDYKEWDKLEKTIDTESEKEPIDEKPVTRRNADIAPEVDLTGKSEIEKRRMAEMDKEKGNEYFTAGDYDTAIIYYTRSLSINPSPASYNNRALVYLKRENYSRCIADCQAVLEAEPDNVKALLRRGSCYKAQSEYSKAKRDFSRVLGLEPHNLRATKLLKETELAWKTKGKKLKIDEVEDEETTEVEAPVNGTINGNHEPVETEKVEKPVAKTDSKEKPVPRRMVIEESDSEEEESSEVKDDNPEERVEDMSSDTASAKTASTDVSNDSGTSTDTSPLHRPVVPERPILLTSPLSPDLARMKEAANTAFRTGQFAQANHEYTNIIDRLKQNPESVVNLSVLYNNRAAALVKMGDCKAAVQDCDRSLECVPHNVKALLRRASAYEVMEKYKDAYRDFKHVLSVDTSVDQAQQGLNRCRKVLFEQYGRNWRSKVTDVVVNGYEIPLIVPESGSEAIKQTTPVEAKPVVEKKQSVEKKPVQKPTEPLPDDLPELEPVKTVQDPPKKKQPKRDYEAEHEALKTEGNQHVGKGQYKEAIECYTQCLKIFPDRSAVFSNRALCYLKIDDHSSAVKDCDNAIRLDEGNVKAWFRRALGRKAMSEYREAMTDLLQVLRLDASNSAAKKELEVIKKAYHDTFAKEHKERKEVDAKKDKSKKEDKKKPVIEVIESEQSEPKSEKPSKSKKNKKGAKTAKESTPQPAAPKTASVSVKDPVIPKLPPVPKLENASNRMEFMKAWNSLKNCSDSSLHAALLDQVQPRHLSKLLGNELDGDMLSKILTSIHDQTVNKDLLRSYQMLHHLRNVQRFQTVAMMMSETDKALVRETMRRLASDKPPCSKSDIASLNKSYNLKD